MPRIENIFSRSYNSEVSTTTKAIIEASKVYNFISDPYFNGLLIKIENTYTNLTLAITHDTLHTLLKQKDRWREKCIRSFFYTNRKYLYDESPSTKKAAKIVESVTSKYGFQMLREEYAEEAKHVRAMLKDLEDPKIKEAIAMLPEEEKLIKGIKNAQRSFMTNYNRYKRSLDGQKEIPCATTSRNEICSVINKDIIEYLRGMQDVNPTMFADFAQDVAEIIKANNDVVRKRVEEQKKPEMETEE